MTQAQSKKETLENLRKEYRKGELSRKDLSSDPVAQFGEWFELALESGQPFPNAMTLSTAAKTGRVTSRVVLLKQYDQQGFVFYTDYRSPKARDIEENPEAVVLFYWPELERQVLIRGRLEKISEEETEAYFLSRPRASQIAAHTSKQSEPIENRDALEKLYEQKEKEFEGADIPVPTHWGGYRLCPVEFELWQGRLSRLNDRFRYLLSQSGEWVLERLQP